MDMNIPGYETLRAVFEKAYAQAATGNGHRRHGSGTPFDKQPMQQIAQEDGIGFLYGQARKKTLETHGMLARGEFEAAKHEVLGAINYLAGAYIRLERLQAQEQVVKAARVPGMSPAMEAPQAASDSIEEGLRKMFGDSAVIVCARGGDTEAASKLGEVLAALIDDLGLDLASGASTASDSCACPSCTLRRATEKLAKASKKD